MFKKSLLLLICFFSVNSALADYRYASNLIITVLRLDDTGTARVGFARPLTGTCLWYGEKMKVDIKTPAGAHIYKTLLAAKISKKPVDVWYWDSIAYGKNETNGCTIEKLSVLQTIGFK